MDEPKAPQENKELADFMGEFTSPVDKNEDAPATDSVPIKSSSDMWNQKKRDVFGICGYDTDLFDWFGESTPNSCACLCRMCDHRFFVGKASLINGSSPTVCPECKRQALQVFDGDKWQKYIKLQLWEFELFLDQYKTPTVLWNMEDRRMVFPLHSSQMKGILGLRVAKKAHIEESISYLDALARKAGRVLPLELRVTEMGGDIWLDTCSDDWGAIRITKDGWWNEPKPPILFRRYDHMRELNIVPGKKEDWDAYVSMMNMASEEDKLLYSGYAASLFFPNIDHPILMPLGPQGSAKTTMSVMTRMLIDPSTLITRGMPADADALPQILQHHYAPTFDNCGYVDQQTSDILCQACTGGGFSKRKLYTDDEDVIFTFRRSVVLNGISAPSMSPDLIDRAIIVELDRIPESLRKERAVIEKKRDLLLPRVRGYLLDVVVGVLRDGPTPSESLPRLADFARIADACAAKMGYKPGQFLQTYIEASRQTAKEAIRSDPLAEAIMQFLEGKDRWEGTTSDLWKELEVVAGKNIKSPNWPKDTTRMSEAICGKLKPGLAMLGWNVGKMRNKTRRSLVFVKNGENQVIGGELGKHM